MTSPNSNLVKSCPKLENGLRLGQEGIHACQLGQFSSPIFWTAEQVAKLNITREMIQERRRYIFDLLNDKESETPCKQCHMVELKPMSEVRFDQLGHIDLAAATTCNLRCNYCGYTKTDSFAEAKFDALSILKVFAPEDVVWDAAVDFNGGEPTLLKNFDDYIDYFTSRRIRVFLYTNGLTYRQSVYDGLINGTVRWVCTSLDAGLASTFKNQKKSTRFIDVLENVTRYAHAGNQGGGRLAIKYIFCADNCSDDDINSFAYQMLAIRPQQVWLTFDFEPVADLLGDCEDFGGYDYTGHINAYAKLFILLKKHGLIAEHFAERHLANVSRQGKMLLDQALKAIEALEKKSAKNIPSIRLDDFREKNLLVTSDPLPIMTLQPLRIRKQGGTWENYSLEGKTILIAPACKKAKELLEDNEIRKGEVVGFLDRDTVLHGKSIEGVPIFPYSVLASVKPDVIIVAAPTLLVETISATIKTEVGDRSKIILFNSKTIN